jgi:hypothetical protein
MKVLSQRGLCRECAKANIDASILQMRERKGPLYRAWKKNINKGARRG